jgi:glycosyltransferase involved in cell wall biosynthesis
MKICFISHSAGDGGAERVLLETIELLQAQGIECRVLLPSEGYLCGELTRMDVPFSVISYPMWMARGKVSFLARTKAAVGLLTNTLQVAWRIFRWKCDLVYSNTATVSVGAFAAWLLGRPHVWHLHEFGLEDQGLSFLFGDRLSLALIDRLSDRCVCVSRALAAKYTKSIEPSKITVIYPSMHRALRNDHGSSPLESVKPDTGRFRCVIVGALIPGKGQEEAILALAHLKKTGIAAELMIVGKGEPEFRRHLEEVVRSNDLVDEVIFAGQVVSAFPAMFDSDAILVCSRSEAFGRVTIEGMSAGRPVIGARSAATAELIQDGVNGLLYDPGDAKDLADKIRYVFEHPQVAESLAGNAQAWVKGYFTPGRYTADLLAILERLSKPIAAKRDLARQA